MLAVYPIAATQENWLHDALVMLVETVHQKIEDNNPITSSQACWKGIVPTFLSPAQITKLTGTYGIRDRLFAYSEEIRNVSPQDRELILQALQNQNEIPALLRNHVNPISIKQSYPAVHNKVNNLFVFAYEKLTDFGVRDRQYRNIFSSIAFKICPFCGIERLMDPEDTAQDQDHYLPKCEYPFSAAYMRNLVPMCRCCNRDYKKTKNLLFNSAGVLRPAFDPYDCVPVGVSLLNSTFNIPIPNWDISFTPDSPETHAWDDVFSIRHRYKRDSLDLYFRRWLEGFSKKCENDRRRGLIRPDLNSNGVRQILAYYHEDLATAPNFGAGFLEPYVFEFLLAKYDAGDLSIINLIRDAVLGISLEEIA